MLALGVESDRVTVMALLDVVDPGDKVGLEAGKM
jgi:hypothetical protein